MIKKYFCTAKLRTEDGLLNMEGSWMSFALNAYKLVLNCKGKLREVSKRSRHLNNNLVQWESDITISDLKLSEDKEIYVETRNFGHPRILSCVDGRDYTTLMFNKLDLSMQQKAVKHDCVVKYFSPLAKDIIDENKDIISNKQFYKYRLNLEYANVNFAFTYSRYSNSVCVIVNKENEQRFNELTTLLSLYYRLPLEVWKEEQYCAEEKRKRIKFSSVRHTSIIASALNPIMQLECTDFNLNEIQSFLKVVTYPTDNKDVDFIDRLIKQYVNCQYYDNVERFISLCTSIISIVDNWKKENNKKNATITDLANEWKLPIDFDVVDTPIKNANLLLTTPRNFGTPIENFRQLRNELIHALPSTELINFLDENEDIIDYLEYADLSFILKKLGITVSSIDQYFDSNEKEEAEKRKLQEESR